MDTILDDVYNSKYILLLTHKNPDVDTISSALAFSLFLDKIGKKYKIFNIEKIPQNTIFLPNSSKISSILPKSFDLAIFFDTADEKRVGIELNLDKVKTICFDHHSSNKNFADINIVDINSPSTAEVVAKFLIEQNIKIDKKIATSLLAGIYDDSKGFSLDRVRKQTFQIVQKLLDSGVNINDITSKLYQNNSLAKYRLKVKVLNSLKLFKEGKVGIIKVEPIWLDECGAKIEDADEFVDEVLSLSIVEVAILLRIKDDKIRVSLRSKNIDVGKVAQKIDGGGHKKAAGATIDSVDFNYAIEKINNILDII